MVDNYKDLFVSLSVARATVETVRAQLREAVAAPGFDPDPNKCIDIGYKLAAMDDAVGALTRALS